MNLTAAQAARECSRSLVVFWRESAGAVRQLSRPRAARVQLRRVHRLLHHSPRLLEIEALIEAAGVAPLPPWACRGWAGQQMPER